MKKEKTNRRENEDEKKGKVDGSFGDSNDEFGLGSVHFEVPFRYCQENFWNATQHMRKKQKD